MIFKYINDDGLDYLWGKIKSHVTSAISGKANTADLATVATSGSYTDLINTPNYVLCTSAEYSAMLSHDADIYYVVLDFTLDNTPIKQVMKNNTQVWPNLPYDAEVEYLMTDGNAYIDTGVQGKCAFEIVGGINRSQSTAAGLFGYRDSSTSNNMCIIWNGDAHTNSGKLRFDFGSGTAANIQNTTASAVANNTLLEYNLSQFKAGNQTITPALNSQSPTTGNLFLLGVNTNGALSINRSGTFVKSCKIVKDGVAVRDYISVRVSTVGYLYDKVSGQLFGNANSTGSFTLGPDVT